MDKKRIGKVNTKEALFEALNPCGYLPEIEITPLSPRIKSLEGNTVYIIKSWADNSGFEDLIQILTDRLKERYTNINVFVINKPGPYMIDDPELWKKLKTEANTFIYVAAPSCSTTSFAVQWSARLEKMGVPGLVLSYATLIEDVKRAREKLGTMVRNISIPYPFQILSEDEKMSVVNKIIDAIVSPLSKAEQKTGKYTPEKDARIAFKGTLTEVQDYYYKQGWTDGFPIIPPTEESVTEMLEGSSHTPDEIITTYLGPERLIVTVEKVAINGVMAGCRPEYFPVLLASVEAFSQGEYEASVRSTNSFSFLQLVNGPIRNEISMNAGTYALGPGNQANATIGRALRLFIINLGGGKIDTNIMAVQGNITSYSFCIPENEERSPWGPFHADLGFKMEDSTVTIFNGGWSHTGNYGSNTDLDMVARDMSVFQWPNGVIVFISPQRAQMLNREGMSKEAVKKYIWSRATTTMKEFRSSGFFKSLIEPVLRGKGGSFANRYSWPREYLDLPDDTIVPIYPENQVYIVVVGGEVSPMMQVWKFANPRTVSIDKWR
jgi:hypothetical protein